MKKINIKIIGVGSSGITIIGKYKSIDKDIDTIALHTNNKRLYDVTVSQKLLLRGSEIKGLASEGDSYKIRDAALEGSESIKAILGNSDIVFIIAGLGGVIGSGAAPIVAKVAKKINALTVCVVTIPFLFEGRKRAKSARNDLEELKRESDFIIIIPNENILSTRTKNLGIKETFSLVDDLVNQEINNVIKLILLLGGNAINLDFENLKTVIKYNMIQHRKTLKPYNIQYFWRYNRECSKFCVSLI